MLAPGQRWALAWLFAQAGEDERALALYRQVLDEAPQAVEPRLQLALLLERRNQVERGARLLEEAPVATAPLDAMKALALGRVMRRQGLHAEAAQVLAEGAMRGDSCEMGAQLRFEQAKALDAAGDVDAVMAALAHAHQLAGVALARRHPDPASQASLAWLDQVLGRPAPATWQAPRADGLPADPWFLVGFPRSGTTLLETVLGAHSRLQVLDERPALEEMIASLRQSPGWQDAELLAALDRLDDSALHQARARYWNAVRRHLPETGLQLVDKYPLTVTRVPYVARLFPRAHWLLLLRHPCDCVLSCHMQAFGLNGGVLAFGTLESTARTYDRVMTYWETQRQQVVTPVHVLRYEDMVQDLRAQVEPVMAGLGLEWEPAQADFARQAATRGRRINTPSYAQVTEPLHAGAVERWRRYRDHFTAPVLGLLRPWVERYGYRLD